MNNMFTHLTENYEACVAVILFAIGMCMLLFDKNLLKKVIGLDIMDSGTFLLLADRGYITGRTVPIITGGVTDMVHYINPIPAGLVLTGIVVSVSVSALMLALLRPVLKKYLRVKPTKTNADRLLGQEALVTEDIDNLRETGAIRINGVLWTAKSVDDTQIPSGSRVVIARIEGAKVYVKPAGVPAEA